MKRILSVILLTISLMQVSTLSVSAQSIRIQKTWLEYNVTNNGVSNLVIHVYLSANNLKGQNISVNAYVDDTKGVGHKDTNGKYKDTGGNVCAYTVVNATYTSSEWKDLKIYLPNSEIHPFSGKHDYYIRVFAFGPNNLRTNGEYVPFTMTGTSGSSTQNQQARKQNSNSQTQGKDVDPHDIASLQNVKIQEAVEFVSNGKKYNLIYITTKDENAAKQVQTVYVAPSDYDGYVQAGVHKVKVNPSELINLVYHDLGDDSKSFCGVSILTRIPAANLQSFTKRYEEIRVPDEIAQKLVDLKAGDTQWENKTSVGFVRTNSTELFPTKEE